MAFVKPTVQRSAVEIKKITGFIMGVRKFGKTTLWANMINAKFGDPEKGLLVSCGMEHGTNMIDNINTTHIDTFKDALELQKWLLSEKGKEHDIRMVCFDSAEEIFNIFEKEIIRRAQIENPTKKIKSIKAAYGGYTNGEKECAKLMKDFLNDLYNAGIMPWMIGHTKLKNVKDKASLDEEGFQRLGSSLISDYEAVVADCFDIVCTGLVDREIEERGSGDSTKRYVKETERRMYFRSNEIVEAGGRLKGLTVPEYIVFDKEDMGKDFIDTIESALVAGRVDGSTETAKPKSTPKKSPAPEPVVEEDEVPFEEESVVEEPVVEEETIVESDEAIDVHAIVEETRAAFKTADIEIKKEIKKLLNGGKLSEDMDFELLTKIHDMLIEEV